MCKQAEIHFHQLGPLGRVVLVVAKSVCLSVCLFVPFPCDFFLRGWTCAEPASSVDWCKSCLALAWNPKNGEVFQIGHDPPPPHTWTQWKKKTKKIRGGDGGDDDNDGGDDNNDGGGKGGGGH